MLHLTGGTLIDGTGRDPLEKATVSCDANRIVAVSTTAPPASTAATVVDTDGLTLLPGLIDAHTHMGMVSVENPAAMSVAMTAAHLFRNAELCLQSGHTTAREVAGADGGLKAVIDAGLVPGPRLHPSGPLLCQTGGHGDFSNPFFPTNHHHGTPGLAQGAIVCDGVDEVRAAARTAFRRGATQLKVCVSGGIVSFTDRLEDTQFTLEELRAAVEEARARGTYVTAHAHNAAAINLGLDAGLQCFEHGTFLDEPTARRLAETGTPLVPTLAVMKVAREDWRSWGIDERLLPRFDGALEAMSDSVRLAAAHGVTIGSGSDLLGSEQNRRGLEIALKAELLGPMAAIVSASATNAAILGVQDDLGTVAPGKLADVIAVDGDPLAEPALFDNPERVVLVVKDGAIVKDLRGPNGGQRG